MEVCKAKMVAKITIFTQKEGDVRVVYFRSGMTIDFVIKWNWYFSYLAALAKVKHPRWKVELTIVNQDVELGEEYKEKKIKNLIKRAKSKITQINNEIATTDLFGFSEQDKKDKIEKYTQRLKLLESGEYDGYIPPEYINDIKKYI